MSSPPHSPMSIEIVIASKNGHKVRELREILKIVPHLDVLGLCDFPDYQPPEETGANFEENAQIKAEHAAKSLQRWVIADDSGIVVPALGGAPGVLSSRYAGNNATDFENRKKLLEDMKHLMDDDRQAFFECCIVLAAPSGMKKCVKGTCEGTLAMKDRGGGGFGYDPLFIKHGYNKTFAELGESVKNRISHRRKAIDKILFSLESFLRNTPENN
ncbi:MAG: deoxyribonucleotide triphosphate pyrophosphatase [uncultured bacterium]|nr:MAG: deoxyribonucleotide triphosphate pyrophosphatase [uncultured bacterium]